MGIKWHLWFWMLHIFSVFQSSQRELFKSKEVVQFRNRPSILMGEIMNERILNGLCAYITYYFTFIFFSCQNFIDMSKLYITMLYIRMHLYMYIILISLIACLSLHMIAFVILWWHWLKTLSHQILMQYNTIHTITI